MNFNAALQYQNNKVNTSSPAELTMMLYEGMIKFCNIAIVAIEQKDLLKANTNIIKAEKILTYLRDTLDFNYPVAQEFENVYAHVYNQLVLANIRKDKALIEGALEILREMRDTWKEVMRIAR